MSVQSTKFSWSKMSEIKRQNVKRCLFGLSDPVKLSEDLERQDKIFSEAEVQRFREKWSFDPITGPIEGGPYEFIAVDPLCEIPSFYTKGYTTVKSKPARLMRHNTPYLTVLSRPGAAKRKLDLEDKHENGNSENIDRLNQCLVHNIDSRCQSLSSSVSNIPEFGDNVDSRLSSLRLTRSSSAPTFPELSPISRNTDIMTPPSKPKSHGQSSIKDYLPITKKQRVNTNAVSKT